MKIAGKSIPTAELTIALGVLMIVAAIIWPASWAYRDQRRSRDVAADIRLLVLAGNRFFVEYGNWPTPHMGMDNDIRYGLDRRNDEVINILRALDAPGNPNHRLNPNRIVFIDPPPARRGYSGINEEGEFVDAWGSPFQIVLDTDMDNICNLRNSIYTRKSGAGIAVWSFGPDRKGDTPDDILSWTLEDI